MKLVLVHFRAVSLDYLEEALHCVSQQTDLSRISSMLVFDNDTEDSISDIHLLVEQYRKKLPFLIDTSVMKHGDPQCRSQSWSVNQSMRVIRRRSTILEDPWVLFTRSDYLMDFTLVEKFDNLRSLQPPDWRGLITSQAYHMAFDERGDQRIEGKRDLSATNWRELGLQVLLDQINGWRVDTSDKDAGTWAMRHDLWQQVGGLDERLNAWGFQQTEFQWRLKKAGVAMVQIPELLFFHQHHGGNFRSYDVARQQLRDIGLSEDDLKEFRDVTGLTGNVCDEVDKP